MKALKCDVCGGLIDFVSSREERNATPNRMEIYYRDEFGNPHNGRIKDICPECYAAVKKAMDDRRPKTELDTPN